MFSLLPVTLRVILASFLWPKQPAVTPPPLTFELRHHHGVSNSSRVVFSDIAPSFAAQTFSVNTRAIDVHRPSSFSAFSSARMRSMRRDESELLQWDQASVVGPDVESRETLLQLATMTANAYAEGPENTSEWYDLGSDWNTVRFSPSQMPGVVFNRYSRASRLAGNLMQMASEDRSLSPPITARWLSA
jgi:hypothetical protein